MSKHTKWTVAIAFALVIGAIIALTSSRGRRGQVNARPLGETNGQRSVIITNGTRHIYNVIAWGEVCFTNDVWIGHSTNPVIRHRIDPYESTTLKVQMPSLGKQKQRVKIICSPDIRGLWQYMSALIKALLRLDPAPTYQLEVELNQDGTNC